MTGYGRTRVRTTTPVPGSITVNGGTSLRPHPSSTSVCIDIAGNKGGVNPLSISHDVWDQVGRVSIHDPNSFVQMDRYPFENQAIYGGHNIDPVVPSDTAAMTKTMAVSNPSRPEVSLPQFIGELKDIPSMLHASGKKTIEGLPRSSAIEYNFGWAPLISDLLKMANFAEHVAKKQAALESLHSSKGLSRGITVFSTTVKNSEAGTYFNSAWSVIITGHVTYEGVVRKWGHVNWVPSVPNLGRGLDLAQQARFLVHGWDLSAGALASTLWELLPWSWFIDYFANVGDYLSSTRNGANAIAQMGCVMHHQRTVAQQVLDYVPPGCIATAGRHRYENKTRVLAAAGITATMPFLSTGQLVTMSSLAQSLSKR